MVSCCLRAWMELGSAYSYLALHSQHKLVSVSCQRVLVGPLAEVRGAEVAVRSAFAGGVSQRLGHGEVLLHVVDRRVQLAEGPVR